MLYTHTPLCTWAFQTLHYREEKKLERLESKNGLIFDIFTYLQIVAHAPRSEDKQNNN